MGETNNLKNNPSTEGLLLVNKTTGASSFTLVRILRKLLNVKKIGYAGTLDPFADGLMLMLIGKKYTQLSDQLTGTDKQYKAKMVLGVMTDTYDSEGEKTIIEHQIPDEKTVKKVLKQFEGEIQQIPPMYSAKKINGKKLYQLARKGIEIERKPIKVKVHIEEFVYEYPYLYFTVTCSSGTYIRSLAHDIGLALKTGAYLSQLTRTKVGPYSLDKAVNQTELSDLGSQLENMLTHL
jgi:tRNA pseudouridine55 synthase